MKTGTCPSLHACCSSCASISNTCGCCWCVVDLLGAAVRQQHQARLLLHVPWQLLQNGAHKAQQGAVQLLQLLPTNSGRCARARARDSHEAGWLVLAFLFTDLETTHPGSSSMRMDTPVMQEPITTARPESTACAWIQYACRHAHFYQSTTCACHPSAWRTEVHASNCCCTALPSLNPCTPVFCQAGQLLKQLL